MFIETAYAQAAGGSSTGTGLESLTTLAPLLLIFVVFYFLLIRPQQQKMKKHKELIAGVRRGDRVVTGGGIVGVVTKVVDDKEVQVEIADGVRVRVIKSTLTDIPARTGAPPPARSKPDPKSEKVEDEDVEPGTAATTRH